MAVPQYAHAREGHFQVRARGGTPPHEVLRAVFAPLLALHSSTITIASLSSTAC